MRRRCSSLIRGRPQRLRNVLVVCEFLIVRNLRQLGLAEGHVPFPVWVAPLEVVLACVETLHVVLVHEVYVAVCQIGRP